MNERKDEGRDLLSHVLLPVAHEDDALATARALDPYQLDQVTALDLSLKLVTNADRPVIALPRTEDSE